MNDRLQDQYFDQDYFERVERGEDARPTPREEPVPEGVVNAWEWRESERLKAVHRRSETDRYRCEHCEQPWPCTGIQMAALAMKTARGDELPPAWLRWTQPDEPESASES